MFPMLRPSFKHVSMNQNRVPSTTEFERVIKRTGRGQYSSGHVFYTDQNAAILEANNIRTLLIVRDPRDVVTSHYNYVTDKNTSHRLHRHYNSLESDSDRLLASIRGVSGEHSRDGDALESIGEWMDNFLEWIDTEYTQIIRFEDLIGPKGGGTKSSQLESVRTIATHLNVELTHKTVEHIADNTFSTESSTFRKGLIGDWVNHFEPVHVEAFKDEAGDWLVDLGYEADDDWSVE